jgi:hypothetical protein
LRVHLIDAIDRLREHERLVATFYSYEGLTWRRSAMPRTLASAASANPSNAPWASRVSVEYSPLVSSGGGDW